MKSDKDLKDLIEEHLEKIVKRVNVDHFIEFDDDTKQLRIIIDEQEEEAGYMVFNLLKSSGFEMEGNVIFISYNSLAAGVFKAPSDEIGNA